MAQARVKATGELIEVIPKGKDGVLHMYDVVGKVYYTWNDLEPVRIKTGAEPVTVAATQITITPTVSVSMITHKKQQ
jgi:hypothetical protein